MIFTGFIRGSQYRCNHVKKRSFYSWLLNLGLSCVIRLWCKKQNAFLFCFSYGYGSRKRWIAWFVTANTWGPWGRKLKSLDCFFLLKEAYSHVSLQNVCEHLSIFLWSSEIICSIWGVFGDLIWSLGYLINRATELLNYSINKALKNLLDDSYREK